MAKKPNKSASKAGKKAGAKKQQPSPTPKNETPVLKNIPEFILNRRLQGLFFFALGFILYANTLGHDFVLDDAIVISDNMFTQKGVEGISGILKHDTFFGFFKVEGKEALVSGGRYRPLSLILFAVTYDLAGSGPFAFHLLTVLLYALTCLVVYRTLSVLFEKNLGAEMAAVMAWVAALIFTVHPVHTEVVANIKGSDEIITLLGSMGALWMMLKAVDTKKYSWAIWGGVVFFLACMAKENAATFVVVIPLALWFFRPELFGNKASGGGLLRYTLPVVFGFLAFFLLRVSILGWSFGTTPMELMNNPFLKIENNIWVRADFTEKLGIVLYTTARYIQLLIFPHPLTHDYYPRHIPFVGLGNALSLLSLVVHIGLLWYAIKGIKKRDPIRFGILYYMLTLSIVSNLIFPIGTNMGERFLFMPSVGFGIVAAGLLLKYAGSARQAVIIAGVISALFALKTVSRNPVWKDNETLFFADIETSENSAKLQNACAGSLFDKAKAMDPGEAQNALFQRAITHATKAIEVYPTYKDAHVIRGGSNVYLKNYDQAVADYRTAQRIAPGDPLMGNYLSLALREAGQYYGEQKKDLVKSVELLTEAWSLNQTDAGIARLLGVANGVQSKTTEALKWFKKAAELLPEDASIQFDLGTSYYLAGQPAEGRKAHDRAVELDPSYKERVEAMRRASGQ